MTKHIGFACKWINDPSEVNGMKINARDRDLNTGSTTVAWLKRQTADVAEQRLWDLMVKNIESVRKLVERVGTLDDELRMVRIGSDILPVYTERTFSWYWRQDHVVKYAQQHFAEVGRIARDRGVRLSFHPGQFTVLASDNPGIVDRSIEELSLIHISEPTRPY